MKKTLFIATLSALASPALWAAATSSQTNSYTIGETTVSASESAPIYIIADSNNAKDNLPTAPTDAATATVLQGGRFKVSNTSSNSTTNHGDIIIASGTDASGNPISGGQLFADGWNTTTNIANKLLIGQSTYQEGGYSNAAIRIHEGSTISGDITLVDDAKIMTSGSDDAVNTISGSVTGEGYTLSLGGSQSLDITGTVHVGGIQSSASTINFQGDVSVSSSVINEGGNLTFSTLGFDTSDLNRYKVKESLEETTVPGEGQNGFSTGKNSYYLIKNTGTSARITATTVKLPDGTVVSADDDGDYIFEATGYTNRYYVNTGNANASDALGAASVTLKDETTSFTLDSTDDEAPSLGSITGAGTVIVAVETVLGDGSTQEHIGLNKSQATGKLIINSGVRLVLGNSAEGGAHSAEIGDISSFSSVDLNGTLRINGLGSDINNVTVGAGGGTLNVWDTLADFSANEITLKGSTTLNGALSITNRWKNNTRIEHLTGSGNLTVASGTSSDHNDRTVFSVDSVKDYTGAITFTKNAGALTANIQIKDGEKLDASRLTIGSGAVVNLKGAGTYELVAGSSSLNGATLSNTEGAQWTGTVRVSGSQSSTLDLAALGTGDSSIALNGVSGSLASATVASDIKLEATGDDALTVTGGQSTVTFNGSVTGGKNIVDKTAGNFTFNGAQNNFTFIGDTQPSSITFGGNATNIAASVKKHGNVTVSNTQDVTLSGDFTEAGWNKGVKDVRLTIDNTGSTTFTGTVDVASVDVQNGSAVAFNGTTSMESLVLSANSTVSLVQGGSLSLSALTVGGESATLNGSLSLGDNASLALDSSLTLNGSLSTGSNLSLSGQLYNSLTSSETTITLFSGVTSWTPTTGTLAAQSEGLVTYSASDVFNTQGWNNNYAYTLSYNGSQVMLTSSQLVPEPTTATLSLLALAGLLARRRRK